MQNKNLWAPWRMTYIEDLSDHESQTAQTDNDTTPQPTPTCFLCDAVKAGAGTEEAEQRLVLVNDRRGVVLLNRYPYTNGHLLVAPSEHTGDLVDLSTDQRAGFIELIAVAEHVLSDALNPQGMNVGINIGRCAGAGLPGHLHAHVVPRWSGDTNYMQVIGQVRVIPQALEASYQRLAAVVAQRNT